MQVLLRTMDLPENESQQEEGQHRKKRLSRREQKARKKQRKNNPATASDVPAVVFPSSRKVDDATIKANANQQPSSPPSAQAEQVVDPSIPYTPTPLPDEEDLNSNQNQKNRNDNKKKTLGKWFPKARVMKSQPSTTNQCTILLFYQYTRQKWSDVRVGQLLQYLERIAVARPYLAGRLRVAPEGVNATISCGDPADDHNSRTELDHFCRDLQHFDPMFGETDFKFLTNIAADRHFKDLKLLPVKELVFYGIGEQEAPLSAGGVHLPAQEFHNMLQDTSQETVVIDVRNHYEAVLGRFDGQQHHPKETLRKDKDSKTSSSNNQQAANDDNNKPDDETTPLSAAVGGGAQYIDPKMRKSTDFPKWLHESKDFLKGKRVMMYCTGGVRCERASAFLKMTMGEDVKGVYQLQGGIERYFQAYPDGGHWRGKNFVFDKRESVSVDNPNGDGGVLQNTHKKKKEKPVGDAGDATKCCLCDAPWDRYVGKRKCETCGVPVLMCDACMASQKGKNHNRTVSEQPKKLARCPLCVEEGITVPVEEVEYTENGVKSNYHGASGEDAKVAPSVLKWGGGHGHSKKKRRRQQRQRGGSLGSNNDRDPQLTANGGRSDSLDG